MSSRDRSTANSSSASFQKKIFEHLAQFSAGPVLFIGSGISQRYLGSPTWDALLEKLANETGRPYQFFRTTVGDSPAAIAEAMSKVFDEGIWSDDRADFRNQNLEHLTQPGSAIKIYTAELLREYTTEPADPKLIEELAILRSCNSTVDVVVTTNYDHLMESIFPDYRPFCSQDELLISETAGVAEIYKIHGSLTDPNSIVLTDSDYREFNSRNAYLAAKLLTLFAEHPIIFFGYSMDDPNVKEILQSLQRCLTDRHLDTLRDKLIFVDWKPSVHEPTITPSFQIVNGSPIPVQLITASDFRPIYRAIEQLPQKLPKKIYRQIREKLYRIILDPSAEAKLLHVQNVKDISSEDEIVIGVGAIAAVQQRGYRGVSRMELCIDCLTADGDLDYESVVAMTFMQLFQASGNFPIFKALRKGEFLDADGNIRKPDSLPQKVLDRSSNLDRIRISSSLKKRASKAIAEYGSFSSMRDNLTPDEVIDFIPSLKASQVELDELGDFLRSHVASHTDAEGKISSAMTKAICVFDVLKYGPAASW